MIENIIDWSARHRWMVLTAYVAISLYGIYSFREMSVDAIPDLSENQVIVYTEWMGRSPQVVEEQLTFPLVTAIQGLAHVKAVRASSMFGMSFVFVIFDDNTDIYFARSRVQERLSTVRGSLPKDAIPTLGPDGTGIGHIYWYTVEGGEQDLGTLRSIQDWYIRYQLSSVEGVAEVASIGGHVKQYQIDLNPVRMRAFGIDIMDVTQALQRNNNEVGGKIIEWSSAEYFVRGQGYIRTESDIRNLILRNNGSGIPVMLGQIADVQIGGDIRRGSLEKDGEGEAVGGIVVMRSGENAKAVIDRIKKKINEITPGLPHGVVIKPSYDRSVLIEQSIETLNRALFEAALTVSLMVAVFLLHARSILRIIIEIPVSILLSFILMRIFDIHANIMSLGGIILAIGVIVDASIVMVENAYRNIAQALETKGKLLTEDYQAIALQSAKQVGRAIFFSELIILVSFLPVFMLTGQEGKLFAPLAFTKTFVMLASAAVVLTLIPVLMTFLMRGKFRPEKENPVTHFFIKLYEPVMHWVLRYRKITLSLNVIALIITIPMIVNMGSEFMPPLDEGSILYMPVTLPNASLTEVNRILTIQDRLIKSVPEVAHVLGKAGRAETATDNAPISMIETIILLKDKKNWRPGITKKDIIQELDSKLQIPGVRNGWTQPIVNRINMLATGVRTDVGFKILGNNADTLEYYAIEAEKILKKVHGASDVVAERGQNGYYLDITIKPEAAQRIGFKSGDLQEIIEMAIGGQNIGTVLDGRMRFPIRARFGREWRDNTEALKQLWIPIRPRNTMVSATPIENVLYESTKKSMSASMTQNTDAASEPIRQSLLSDVNEDIIFLPLGQLAEVKVNQGPTMVNSENGMLRSVVYMNTAGRDLDHVVEDAKVLIQSELKLPEGYTYQWSGQYEHKIRAQRTLMIIIPIVFILIFLLLYFTVRDPIEALVVMLSVPFALIGGVYMNFILGYNFSVAVWVGFIALYGIATETGVIMVVYLHEALDRRLQSKNGVITQKDVYEATIEGSVLRLRPKLMTVGTALIGLVPIMWSTGTGADVMKPLTAPMIGGLITSAIHVLIVTPVLFAIMKERALSKGTLKKSKMAHWIKES